MFQVDKEFKARVVRCCGLSFRVQRFGALECRAFRFDTGLGIFGSEHDGMNSPSLVLTLSLSLLLLVLPVSWQCVSLRSGCVDHKVHDEDRVSVSALRLMAS